jgi:hypothetical protein
MAAKLKLIPGSTIRWGARRFVVVDYVGLDAVIAREVGKRICFAGGSCHLGGDTLRVPDSFACLSTPSIQATTCGNRVGSSLNARQAMGGIIGLIRLL